MFARLRRVAFLRAALPAWAILGAGLLLTALVGMGMKWSIDADAKLQIANACDEIVHKIHERLVLHDAVLRAGVGLFARSGEVSRSEWRAFYEKASESQLLAGVQAFGFLKLIRQEELHSHISAVRAEGFPDYTVRPEGRREIYAPVVYYEPFRDRNVRSLGVDGLAEPVRRNALERSRGSGRSALSGKITLSQETDTDIQAGFGLHAPIYRTGAALATMEQRRSALIGWAIATYRARNLMEEILRSGENQRQSEVALFIYDRVQPIVANMLYRRGSRSTLDADSVFYVERRMDFNDHPWLVICDRDPSTAGVSYMVALLSAGAGTAISVLLFVLVLALRSSRSDPQSSSSRTH